MEDGGQDMSLFENTVDVIIPTLGALRKTSHPYTCFEKIHHIPWPIRIHIVTKGRTWAEAINIGLEQTSGRNDVVIMDDDVFINKFTFLKIPSLYDRADIFGFKLLFPNGLIQHAGGFVKNGSVGHIGYGEEDKGQYDEARYVCHATTSLIYIKRSVLNSLRRISEDIPGVQMEDVDFSFRALKENFRILYTGGMAVHIQSATKRSESDFEAKISTAFHEIVRRHFSEEEFLRKVESYPHPVAVQLEIV